MHEVTQTSDKRKTPLFVYILVALIIGAVLGHIWHIDAGGIKASLANVGIEPKSLKWVSELVISLLRLLATPLIFAAVVSSLVNAKIGGKQAGKLTWLLMSNTVLAILIGLLVANTLRPGDHITLVKDDNVTDKEPYNIWSHIFDSIPRNFIDPFAKNDIIGIIILAIGLGIAMRLLLNHGSSEIVSSIESLRKVMRALFELMITMLKWVFNLVPLAVLAVVIRVVGEKGIESLTGMIYWIGSVVLALLLMGIVYLGRMWYSTRMSPLTFLKGGFDAFAMAFSTASSAATLPLTYKCAIDKLKVKEENANLGIMVGGTFNHDGTALYEAMAALFIAQGLGMQLGFSQQVIVVIMSVIASVGAAGIPEAGLVTMLAVFTAVKLPTEYIGFLLTVDWFLDRCRTTINVMGDMASTVILNGRQATQSDVEVSTS
jgi:Na+/H+-dicarboxylate symporter